MDLLELLAKLAPSHLFADPRSVQSPLYIPAAVIFMLIFLGGIAALVSRDRLAAGNRLHRRIIERYATWAASVGASGIVFILLRFANVPLFSKRIWTVLNVLVVLAIVGHYVWYRTRQYPEQLADYRDDERKRRFFPTTRRTTSVRRSRRRR